MQQFLTVVLYILLAITSLFLICLVLIQRGKGGGLAGAFGGSGGSSAFGSKAGDVFTRVTMISAGVWISLNMLLVVLSNSKTSAYGTTPSASSKSDFTPSNKLDLDKLGTPGSTTDLGTGLPLPIDSKPVEIKPAAEAPATTPVTPPASPKDVPSASPKS